MRLHLRSVPVQRGFSLLEVLVALAIMAMSLGALYHAAGGSVRGVQVSERRAEAALLAAALLDSRDTIPPGGLQESGAQGDRFSWVLTATPFPTGHEADPGWPLYRVLAVVAWEEGGERVEFALASLLPERRPLGMERR